MRTPIALLAAVLVLAVPAVGLAQGDGDELSTNAVSMSFLDEDA